MSDGGKIESEIINYSVSRGNKYNQMENERTVLMESESRLTDSSKSGSEIKFSFHLNCLQRPVEKNFVELKKLLRIIPFAVKLRYCKSSLHL